MSDSTLPPDWGALYRRYCERLLSALTRRGIPASERRDVLHEALVTLMGNHAAGKLGYVHFGGLAKQECRHAASQHHRRSRRTDAVEYEDSPQLGSESAHETQTQIRRLEAAAGSWPERERQVFHRRFVLNETAPVIAQELKISVQHVRNLCCMLRARCRSLLDETP